MDYGEYKEDDYDMGGLKGCSSSIHENADKHYNTSRTEYI